MEIELLDETRLRYWTSRLAFPLPAVDELADIARIVRGEVELYRLFEDFHLQTAVRGEWHREWSDLPFAPLVERRFGERASLFYLLAYLAALPYTWLRYKHLGISERIFDDTLQDITVKLIDEYELHGKWRFKLFQWIWLHLDCQLFRLGRLQYILRQFQGLTTAYRRRSQGEQLPKVNYLLLADPTLPLRSDGYALGSGGDHEAESQAGDAWYARFESSAAGWFGNPVSPYGFVLREPVFLSRADWELALQQGDWVLDLHIPRSGAFTVEACRESLHQAFEFFPRIWHDRPFKACFCHTWFFTPQLQRLLSPDSNIVRFQREFYLYPPYPGSLRFLWEFVFGERYPDRATAPRDNRLRKAVLEWLDQGGEIFDLAGMMFHGPDEWGSQPYMSAWDAGADQPRFIG